MSDINNIKKLSFIVHYEPVYSLCKFHFHA